MTQYREFKIGGNQGGNPFGMFTGIIFLTLFFVLLYFLAKGVFTILSYVAPVLLIITLILDYQVVVDYGKFVWKTLKGNPFFGIVLTLLTVIGFPIVTGFLFFRAMVRRKLRKAGMLDEKPRDEFTEYEVVEEEDFLELPELKEDQPPASEGDYDNLFK